MALLYKLSYIISYYNTQPLGNLIAVVKFLRRYAPGIELIVVEQGKAKNDLTCLGNIKHVFIQQDSHFDRVLGLNTGIKHATNHIVVLGDSNFIISPEALNMGYQNCHIYDMVIPYDTQSVICLPPDIIAQISTKLTLPGQLSIYPIINTQSVVMITKRALRKLTNWDEQLFFAPPTQNPILSVHEMKQHHGFALQDHTTAEEAPCRHKMLYMITTYNRINFLQQTIKTWAQTRNKKYQWTLIVADDGSTDGTIEYLQSLYIPNVKIFVLKNQRRGVHHQTNALIKFALCLDFDFGFKSDDDLLFLKPHWDRQYFKAAQQTGYYHLIYYDRAWGQKRLEVREPIFSKNNLLENYVAPTRIQGALWTFNKSVLQNVGFFDTDLFNLCGYGHVDYSLRCCRLGYNDIQNPYDAHSSNDFITLNKNNYVSNNNFSGTWNTRAIVKQKQASLLLERTYVPYNERLLNLQGQTIAPCEISFIVPLRGRENMIAGFEYNIQQIFGNYAYEIIYVHQNNNKLFRRGQLCNIGFQAARGNIIIFQDIDIRHLRPIVPKTLLNQLQAPFVAFDKITQLEEFAPGHYNLLETQERPSGWGACAIFTREQFILSGGFSNLILGWGAEDNIMQKRANFVRYKQDLGHVKHPSMGYANIVKMPWYQSNRNFWLSDHERDPYQDGYMQTQYQGTIHQLNDNAYKISAYSIDVPAHYQYLDLYQQAILTDQEDLS